MKCKGSKALAKWRASRLLSSVGNISSVNSNSRTPDLVSSSKLDPILESTFGAARSVEAWDGPECEILLRDERLEMDTRLQLMAQYDPGTMSELRKIKGFCMHESILAFSSFFSGRSSSQRLSTSIGCLLPTSCLLLLPFFLPPSSLPSHLLFSLPPPGECGSMHKSTPSAL